MRPRDDDGSGADNGVAINNVKTETHTMVSNERWRARDLKACVSNNPAGTIKVAVARKIMLTYPAF